MTRTLLCLIAWVLLTCAAVAAETSRSALAHDTERVPIDRKTTEQKALFLRNLVGGSVAAMMIEESGDEVARQALARARALVEKADDDLAAGRLDEADAKLDEAVQLVNTETRRLSQGDVREKRAQLAYEKRLKAVRTFLAAYDRVAEEKARSDAFATQIGALQDLVSAAEALAKDGKVAEARALLDKAYFTAKSDIRELRQGDTLVRSLSFATPEDEYDYEIDRNDSHVMLLRLALSENPVGGETEARIAQLRGDAEALRRQAEGEAAARNHQAAIATLSRSTDALLKAIRMTGIFIPGG